MIKRFLASLPLLMGLWLAGGHGADAQSYPTRAVRAIVAFAPGGVTDTFTRLVAQKLSEDLGQQFYVDNISGASGNIGTAQAAKAAPDGYTLYFAFSSYAVNPTLFDQIPYDPAKDFDPVTLAVTSTTVLTVNPMVPAHSVKELVALIRSSPGKFSYSTAGAGTQAHLAGEQFRLLLNLDLVHVPYNGGAPAIMAVVGGHTPIGFSSPAASIAQIQKGNVRALAVTGAKRSRIFPDVPTMAEAGYPQIMGDSWVGVLVPAGTPKDIINLLQREIAKIIATPDMQARLTELGYDPVGSSPEEFGARIKSEIVSWGQVIRAAHITVQ
ncbi:MAG TPA: tripartite tricarboxylate transporter substrate binding protein [Xanthobacteraceae bacterium]|nr:tripartite tricarboxylate transporter substrate binding protein [Xanthobacteraceae bacterium]